ncbi:MAG TPA: FAD-dependent oxidoreductase [Terriglobia bacterium]|nr:FAD-dependent oxidoreductase [Terriglobia bacterium]
MSDMVIIGAGPSGLAAAYELTKHGAPATVLETSNKVGGLARTLEHDGCLFDIGPHRFYTKNREVQQLYLDILAEDVVVVKRLTRILYNNRFFDYPLTPLNVVGGLGLAECGLVIGAYGLSQIRQYMRPREERTFEDWVTNRFGARLYETFFKNYTEKVWGIPCSHLGADWAAQRIKGLSLPEAARNAVFRNNGRVKSLISEFLFPRMGSGQLYEKMRSIIQSRGGIVRMNSRVNRIRREGKRVRSLLMEGVDGVQEELPVDFLLSSAPITDMVEMMDPPPPEPLLAACRALQFRDHLGIHLKLQGVPFSDNWIYIHSKEVKMARLANYRNFSPVMAGGVDEISPVTAEYFASRGDSVWSSSDEALIAMALHEMKQMKLLRSDKQVLSGFVVRSAKAYPVMEIGYEKHIGLVKSWLSDFENLLPIGRSGMFKYNNQDHAIATGLLAARRALGLGKFDPWLVNIDAEYLEEVNGSR